MDKFFCKKKLHLHISTTKLIVFLKHSYCIYNLFVILHNYIIKTKLIWRVFLFFSTLYIVKKATFTLNICIFTTTKWIVVLKHHCVLITRLSFYYYFLEVYSSSRGIVSAVHCFAPRTRLYFAGLPRRL